LSPGDARQRGRETELEFLKIRHADDPNPFVIGKDTYLRYLDIQSECALAALARNGQKIEE
jgi:hypothetical protein